MTTMRVNVYLHTQNSVNKQLNRLYEDMMVKWLQNLIPPTSYIIIFVFRYSVHSSSSKENKILYPADTEYHRFSVYLHTQ